jgi:hypothetical protein
MSIKDLLEEVENTSDLAKLRKMQENAAGPRTRDVIEARIATILRAAPVVGRCIKEAEERLECPLTDEEALRVAREAGTEMVKHAEIVAGLKRQVKDETTLHDEQEARRNMAIDRQMEERPVIVQWLQEGQIVRKVRMDTGEELSRRAATDEEMQEPIPFDEPAERKPL